MPIATPQQYAEMLDSASAGGYALAAVNVSSSQTLNAVMRGFARALPDHHGDAGVRHGLPCAVNLGKRFEAGAHAGLALRCDPSGQMRRGQPREFHEGVKL